MAPVLEGCASTLSLGPCHASIVLSSLSLWRKRADASSACLVVGDFWKVGLGLAAIVGFGGYAVWKAVYRPRRIMGGRLISDHPVYSLARGRGRRKD